MTRSRSLLVASVSAVLGLAVGVWLEHAPQQAARAQVVLPDDSRSERDQLYEDLQRQVALLQHQGQILKTVIQLAGPSVVHIDARKTSTSASGSGRPRIIDEAGSGIIIEHRGEFYVLTNRHVIKDAAYEQIAIRLEDGRELRPRRIWSDADTDIAVMAVAAPRLVPARLGNSDDVEMGDFVLAVGSPFGLSRSVTFGIISAKGRRDLQLGGDEVRYQDFLQTDAAINPGNSGGPLLNLRGEVVGMNTAIASSSGGNEGIGFSIPINMVMIVARQLIDNGEVRRAYLGVNLDSKFGAAAAEQLGLPRLMGTRIVGITPNSPAEAAGLRVGDVILRFNGQTVEDDMHLVNLVSLTSVGQRVVLDVLRDGQQIQLRVTLGDRRQFDRRSSADPPLAPAGADLGRSDPAEWEIWDIGELGLAVVDLTPELARRMRLSPSTTGMLVAEVDPQGPTAGRIRQGDIIDQVEMQPVAGVHDLDRVLAGTDLARGIRLRVVPSAGGSAAPRTIVVHPTFRPARQ